MNSADVLHINRRTVFDLEHDVLDIGDTFEITAAAHEIFGRRNFESLTAYVAIARFYAGHDFAQWDAVREQRVWIEIDLVFFYETADGRDFGNAFYRFKRVT